MSLFCLKCPSVFPLQPEENPKPLTRAEEASVSSPFSPLFPAWLPLFPEQPLRSHLEPVHLCLLLSCSPDPQILFTWLFPPNCSKSNGITSLSTMFLAGPKVLGQYCPFPSAPQPFGINLYICLLSVCCTGMSIPGS